MGIKELTVHVIVVAAGWLAVEGGADHRALAVRGQHHQILIAWC